MNKKASITIAIATYNRPTGLKKLLDGLVLIDMPEQIASTVVVVADNSEDGNAEMFVKETAQAYPWKLVYYHVPERGITYPRNRGLKEALNNRSDYLAYIDDDEVPDKKWIYNLLAVLKETGAAVVSGGVVPVFEIKPAWWIEKGNFFEIVDYPDKEPINYAHAGNVLIDTQVVRSLKLEFHPDFSLTGGEDTLFFNTIRNAGYQTVFSKQAIIYEDITKNRARFMWLIKRWYRTGNTDGLIMARNNNTAMMKARILFGGIARVGSGVICALVKLPLLLSKNPSSFECIRIVMRGIGFVHSVTGFAYQEYRIHKR